MRTWIRALAGAALATTLTVQPVAAVSWNEAVGWVDFYRDAKPVVSFYGISACTTTTCEVVVRVRASDFRTLQAWGCTSQSYTLPAGTTYSMTNWRTQFAQCSGQRAKPLTARFLTRVDFLDATGTTRWVAVDEAVSVTIRVLAQ